MSGAQVLTLCADLSAIGALAGVVYAVLTVAFMRRLPRTDFQLTAPVPVSVLVPLCGAEDGLYDRLAALCRQNYPCAFEIVCGAVSPADPALEVARRVARDFPDTPMIVSTDTRLHGLNRKISNLTNMLPGASHDIIVMLDSDIIVEEDHLARMVAALDQPGVGAATCLYHGVAGAGPWAALSSLNINLQFVPNVILGIRSGLARPCFGSTLAISRTLLTDIGGLRAFAGCLHDDYAIGAAVRSAGHKVVISFRAVGHMCLEQSARELVESELRRDRTVRAIDPIGYAGAAITHSIPLAVLAMLLGSPLGFPLLLAAGGARLAQCLCIERALGLPAQDYWMVPLRDCLSFVIYLAALMGSDVVWRGERYRISNNGRLGPRARRMKAMIAAGGERSRPTPV
ncbi:MAG: bacteriohopanetetrol glucosamine biosynthesis glycosyltransferase HpnI [Caulobacteraceae bacterium]